MKNISLFWIFLILLSLGCTKDKQTEPIVLGAIYNLTGGQAALDISSSKGAQLAIQQANEAGGVHDQMLELLLKDGQTNTDTLKAKVLEVLEEAPATLAFLGLSDSDQVLAAAGEAASHQRVFMTSGATSPLLPGQIPDYLFLACFGDNVQAAAAAEYAYDTLGAASVSILYDSTDTYTRLLQGYFTTRFEELGGQVNSQNAYSAGSMATAVQAAQAADLIFFAALPQDVLPGIQLIRQAGINVPVIGGDSYDEPDVWQGQNQLGEVYFTTHAYLGADNPKPEVQAFRQSYMNAYGGEEPNAFAALGYDAARLLIRAVEHSDSPHPESIRQALTEIQGFNGVTGTISFGPDSRIPSKSVTIMEVVDGSQKFVLELTPVKIPVP
ncbi:MAG: ABC transporter substrate-binding protein [Lewinellaceae bacterium]|nr:ABC transporter substrate-binding protein [Lewinellaceae bacterium]